MPLPPYTTTVVGAYSVPRWYEALERAVEAGTLARADMVDAQWRASQAAVVDQEMAGIDVVNGGEMHRRFNNRHAPPNAMLNHFWQKLPGFEKAPELEYGIVTRPRPITPQDLNVFHPAAVCTGPITYADLGLVEEFERVAEGARDPASVKVTMTGPHMLAKVAWDEHYGDIAAMMDDLAKVINTNLRALAQAGCRHVQIDEPLFAAGGTKPAEVEAAVEAVNQCLEDVPAFKWVHLCQGNYAVGAHYDGPIGHRYFAVEPYPIDLICRIECDALMNEGDMTPHYEGRLRSQQLCVGAVDVQDVAVETPEAVAERVREWGGGWLAPEQTLLTTSCGLNHLPREVALGKLRALAGAKAVLGGRREPALSA